MQVDASRRLCWYSSLLSSLIGVQISYTSSENALRVVYKGPSPKRVACIR